LQPIALVLRDPGPRLFGNEPIWARDRLIGHVVCAGYSARCNAAVAFGRVYAGAVGAEIEVEVAMERCPANVMAVWLEIDGDCSVK
jgi:glycine cleavage system aminomethyltransferase T